MAACAYDIDSYKKKYKFIYEKIDTTDDKVGVKLIIKI